MPIKLDFSDKVTSEKYSSAFSLSDMEIFIFPELLYPLVISNIMSPILWEWRNDLWFKDVQKKSFNYKVNRVKQYIMEHYIFNLDLETWGMTKKDVEIDRFKDFMDIDFLKQSNALFGYEGDKYYFDIDIRKHFGLDKYTTDVIPYWKTETVEAMTAFRYKDTFSSGAGECVSLSALYAAALFVVAQIPLEHIFLIGTPLHSQNFIDVNEGLLTNNRRIVTKKMWFNGTSISAKARRALENEKVTIVSHLSGYIHHMYPKATIDISSYQHFTDKLKGFLTSGLTSEIFINFLRYHMNFKKCFQYKHCKNSRCYYISLELIFEYEHSTKYSFSEVSREALLNEIDDEEFSLYILENRIIIQDVETYLDNNKGASLDQVMGHFMDQAQQSKCNNVDNLKLLFKDLSQFLNTIPQLPPTNKTFIVSEPLEIHANQSRNEIINYVNAKARSNETALLSLYVFRQMDKISWEPFLKAAIERNPVALEGLKGKSIDEVYQLLVQLKNESIYDGQRLAQPDEVWNFQRGDGVEKAILFADFLVNEAGYKTMQLTINKEDVSLMSGNQIYRFQSAKGLVFEKQLNY